MLQSAQRHNSKMEKTKKTPKVAELGSLSAKGAAKRNEIIAAARAVLVDGGSAALTARHVARQLGVSLSHVQYYFPDRDQIIKAILEQHLSVAQERIARSSRTVSADAAVKVVLKDQRSKESCRIFWELWALTGRDDNISRLLNDFYVDYVSALEPFVRELNQALSPAQVRVRSVLIAAMLEGLSLFRGYGRKPPVPFSQLDPSVLAAIQAVAKMEDGPLPA